jgi:hypothetical protein
MFWKLGLFWPMGEMSRFLTPMQMMTEGVPVSETVLLKHKLMSKIQVLSYPKWKHVCIF